MSVKEEKIIRGWIIIDYRTGTMRVAKRLRGTRGSVKASEVPIEVSIKVEIPEQPLLKAEGTIKLSQTHLSEMILEAIAEPPERK